MCGIVGVVRFRDEGSRPPIEAMTAQLQHRGPDAVGYWDSGGDRPRVCLGHTRLSIIDLADSVQPMTSDDGRYVLVFNGEIFNYRELRDSLNYPFRTHGDTEVLLAGLITEGTDFLPRLRGQFAFAFYDNQEESLLLARDRLGVLPLVFHLSNGAVHFASEIKALLPALSPKVDEGSLDAYLAYGSTPAPFTLFQGVRKLLPGHTLKIDRSGRPELRQYWRPPAPENSDWTDEAAIEQVRHALHSAVQSCLVADVSVGAYLSGGLDSSLIVAVMRSLRPGQTIETFCAGFGDPRFDETPHARKVAELLSTEHHEVAVRPEDFADLWSTLTWHRDAPVSQPADIAVFRLAQAARQRVKVVLSGEGSDELFAGYPKYSMAEVTGRLGMLGGLAPAVDGLMRSSGRARVAERALLAHPRGEAIRTWFAPFPAWQRRRLRRDTSAHPLPAYPPTGGGLQADMLHHDLLTWLPDNLLERGDRMSMAASLELRPPFLDHELVELAFRLPARMKVRAGRRKWVVKQVARRYLPDDIVDRQKVGFRVPLDAWFREGLKDLAGDLLCSSGSFVAEVFERREVETLLESHLNSRSNEERGLWALLSLEVWHRRFFTAV